MEPESDLLGASWRLAGRRSAAEKHYVCDRLTGDKIACTAKGKPLPKFKPGVSGVVKAQARSQAGEPVCS